MNDSNQMSLDDLARAWWKYFGSDDWEAERLKSPLDDIEAFTCEVSSRIDELSEDPQQLGSLLECLVSQAPEGGLLSFIGTTVVEDAYRAMGAKAFLILERSNIPLNKQRDVLAGFLF